MSVNDIGGIVKMFNQATGQHQVKLTFRLVIKQVGFHDMNVSFFQLIGFQQSIRYRLVDKIVQQGNIEFEVFL
ncbi:hypothetical protein D3C86_1820890 [compost metagenome]